MPPPRSALLCWLGVLGSLPQSHSAFLQHAAARTFHPVLGSTVQPRPQPDILMRSLTDESVEAIKEIVLHDVQMVLRTAKGDPLAALDLARDSNERRIPMLAYLVEYKALKARLSALQVAISSARHVAPWTVDDLDHGLWVESMRLARHKRKLRAALRELTPIVRGRVLQTARERPALIPSLSSGLVRSGWYKIRWRVNSWFGARQLRSEEAYERTRALLVDKWLARALELHRMANPLGDAPISRLMRTRPRLTSGRERGQKGRFRGERRHLRPLRSAGALVASSSAGPSPARRLFGRAWLHSAALWLVTRRASVLLAYMACRLTLFRRASTVQAPAT
jgi:hypothetical protein